MARRLPPQWVNTLVLLEPTARSEPARLARPLGLWL